MNARSHVFEFVTEFCHVEEVVLSVFHTLLFHRSTGKFHYRKDNSYTIGTVGFEDVDCQFIDFTYVKCACGELDQMLRKHTNQFKEALRSSESHKSGQISLEFYQRKKNQWPFPTESVPWELWTVKVDIVTLTNESEKESLREKLAEELGDKVRCIADLINRPEYVPKMPNESELENVFDSKYKEVQPYLHKIAYNTSATSQSVGSTMRKLFRDTFNY
eukprot:Seg1085.12 transcript_id=Seg1085.12/GoldUCD/mRNA.D3Y31 product="Autophagy-related protein 101" protein_id=Seg1085.12/GoldUCD/D3Y31